MITLSLLPLHCLHPDHCPLPNLHCTLLHHGCVPKCRCTRPSFRIGTSFGSAAGVVAVPGVAVNPARRPGQVGHDGVGCRRGVDVGVACVR